MRYDDVKLEAENFKKVHRLNIDDADEINLVTNKPIIKRWSSWLCQKIDLNSTAFVCAYLNEEQDVAKKYAEQAIGICHQLFWGEWRNLPVEMMNDNYLSPEAYALEKTPWMQPFIFCAALTLAFGKSSEAQKIASYPSEKCEDMMLGAKEEDRYLYLFLAQWIATGTWNAKFEDFIQKGKKKSPQMALLVLASLRDNDQEMYQKAFFQYMAHFKKYDFSNHYFDEIFSYIGTILFYLGHQKGFSITDPKVLNSPYLILGL